MIDVVSEYEAYLKTLRPRRSEVTITDYTSLLRRMDRELPAGLLCATTDELEAWIFQPRRNGQDRSDNTLQHYVVIAKGFTRWATDPDVPRAPGVPQIDYDAAAALPTISAEAENPARAATPEEVADVLARTDELGRDLFTLAAYAGYRCVEIHRGRREHIGAQELRVHGKGGRFRRVPTHPAIRDRFAGRRGGPLARAADGTPLLREQIIAQGGRRLRQLGYDDLSMHSLRKYFGTQVYENSGRDIRVAQELLGHRYVTTTQVYVAVNRDRAASAVLALAAT